MIKIQIQENVGKSAPGLPSSARQVGRFDPAKLWTMAGFVGYPGKPLEGWQRLSAEKKGIDPVETEWSFTTDWDADFCFCFNEPDIDRLIVSEDDPHFESIKRLQEAGRAPWPILFVEGRSLLHIQTVTELDQYLENQHAQ